MEKKTERYSCSNPGIKPVAKIVQVGTCTKKRGRSRPCLLIDIVEIKVARRTELDKGTVIVTFGRGQGNQLDPYSRTTFKTEEEIIGAWRNYCDSGGYYGSLTLTRL